MSLKTKTVIFLVIAGAIGAAVATGLALIPFSVAIPVASKICAIAAGAGAIILPLVWLLIQPKAE